MSASIHRKALALLLTLSALALPVHAQIGETQFVDGNTPIEKKTRKAIGKLLPEISNSHAAFLSPIYTTTLDVKESAQVRVHFVWESVGFRNSLGYVTYTDNPLTIVDRQLIFPNASRGAGPLTPGDHSLLRDASGAPRTFAAGEKIAFFLVADGFDVEPQIANWNASTATLPSLDPAVNAASSNGKGTYTSLDELNPEIAVQQPRISRHAATLSLPGFPDFLGGEPFIVVGFEQKKRTHSDHDFNDLVIAVESNPLGALETDGLAVVATDDPDGDGIRGTSDHYPNDPTRALVTSLPPYGWVGVGLEDLYPSPGDGDFNDTFLVYRIDMVTSANGDVMDILCTVHLLARGAALDHRLGFHLPGLPGLTTGTIDVERFLSNDAETHTLEPVMTLQDLINLRSRRLETVLPHSSLAMPNVTGKFAVNTLQQEQDRMGASSRFLMSFDTAVPAALLGPAPWDLYWLVHDGTQWFDVHMPGFPSFADHPPEYPPESGPEAYLDDAGYPWMIHVPDDWRFPLEYVSIGEAYPAFLDWAASHGTENVDWFESPVNGLVSQPATEFFVRREWTVQLPQP